MAIFYTGSYIQQGTSGENSKGNGIGCFQLNIETGEVQLLHYTKQRNPSYLVISDDIKYLYAVEKMYAKLNPRVYAYKILEDGVLSLLNSQEITGDYACHIDRRGEWLIAANQDSDNLVVFKIDSKTRLLKTKSKLNVCTPVNICWL